MSKTAPLVAIVATLDSKGVEADFLRQRLQALGRQTLVVDIGTAGAPAIEADVSRAELVRVAGDAAPAEPASPAEALTAMGVAAGRVLARLFDEGRLAGAIGVGGGKGSAAFFEAVVDLPYGFPRILVTSARPAMLAAFASRSDLALFPTLVDLFGLNGHTERVLSNAASAIAAMRYEPPSASAKRSVAITAFGVTSAAVAAIKRGLEQAGLEVLTFPANGAGGRTMEAMIAKGSFDAVIDLTTTEIADLLMGGTASAGEGRLTAAGARGIPQLIAPGAVDMVNFGPPDSVPADFAGRLFYRHTPHTTLMRTTVEENRRIALATAERLNAATGPVTVFWPSRGHSDYDREGKPFFDPEADRAWRDALFGAVADSIATLELDCHINDAGFAAACVDWALEATGQDRAVSQEASG